MLTNYRNAQVVDKKHLSAPAAPSQPPVVIAVNPQVSSHVSDVVDPSPIAPSSNGTEFTDMEEGAEEEKREEPPKAMIRALITPKSPPPAAQPPLTVSVVYWENT